MHRPTLAIALALAAAPVSVRGQVSAPDRSTFTRHVVVAQEGYAADVGRDVLRNGGNAIDAAVATAFALAVTHPAAGNLGGGGFLVTYDATRREVRTFDFREAAPKAASSASPRSPRSAFRAIRSASSRQG